MLRDIINIMKIYIRKYFAALIILLIGFSLFTAMMTISHLKTLKDDIARYEFNVKTGNDRTAQIQKMTDREEIASELRKIEEDRDSYVENYNDKLTKEKVGELAHSYAVGVYFNAYPIYTTSSFFAPREDINVIVGQNNKEYKKYLTAEELKNEHLYDELRQIEPGSAKYTEKALEVAKMFPTIPYSSTATLREFAKENLDSSKLELKETLYSTKGNIGYYMLIVLIPLLIFGVEYHTNFGKFIASLPFKKERIYFSKVILSLLILLLSYVIVGFTNVIVTSGSFLGDVYSFSNTFGVVNKVYILGVGLVLLGAIFASFCGSILTIGAMYLPALLLQAYPFVIVVVVGRMFNQDFWTQESILEPIYAPIQQYFDYVPWKYIIIYLAVLVVLTIVMSKVYLAHNVEREGEFFTIAIVDVVMYIILLFGVLAFGLLVLSGVFKLNAILSSLLLVIVVPYLMWKVSRLKIRV